MLLKTFLLLIFIFPTLALSQSQDLKIGLSVPLTGPLQEYGVAVKNAFSLAASDLGVSGYELIYEDNQFEGKSALTNFKALTEVKKVDLIYLWGEPCLYAVSPLSDLKKIPIFSMSVDKRAAKGHPYVFRTVNPSQDFIAKVFEFLRSSNLNTKSFKKLGVILTEDPYFEGLLLELKSQALAGEEIIEIAKVPGSQMDLKTEILKAKSSNLDALAIYLSPGQVSSAYRNMRNIKYVVPTMGTDVFESANEVKDSQGSMIGARYHNLKMPEDFGKKYLTKFGNDLQVSYAYNAYTTAMFLLSKVKELQLAKAEGKELKDEIIRLLSAEKGLPFEVKTDGDYGYYFSYPLVIKEVREDGFKSLF